MALNPNFTFLSENLPELRVAALQGGTRSGKTYSTLQYLIDLADTYSGLTISIVRESWPSLRATALRDFIDIMTDAGLFHENNVSKPSGYYEYTHNGNLFEFFSVDNGQKVRGRKRDFLFINEANEITLEKFRQLAFRTTGRIIVDYNPSDGESFIYDHVLTREDCECFISTYKDNPHLTPEIIEEIELLQDADPEYWKVFGEGQRGKVSGIILGHYKIELASNWPIGKGKKVYGVDFGYSAPAAVTEVTLYDNIAFVKVILYRRKLTNTQLIAELNRIGVDKSAPWYCDSAEPDRIAEFKLDGFNAHKAEKDIENGLDSLRSKPLRVHEGSTDLINEIKGYRYKVNPDTGEVTTIILAVNGDHAIDSARYAVHTHTKGKPVGNTTAKRVQPKRGREY